MRTTTIFIDATAQSVSRLSAPIPDGSAPPPPAALTEAPAAAAEAAWDAFERASFPELNR
jgi:hypothetical protein